MSLNEIFLTIAALVPAVIICLYVYHKDRAEKEPLMLLIGLLLGGVAICFPASVIEVILGEVIDVIFFNYGVYIDDSFYFYTNAAYYLYQGATNFIGVALVEEGLKWLVLIIVARNTRHFNSLFDGIIYAVFVSLGFAALENVLYVLEYGLINALVRGIMSVPGHAFFGVIMGYYYSFYHMTRKAHQKETRLKNSGVIRPSAVEFSENSYLVLSILMPVAGHGFYDFCCSVDSWLATISLYVFVAFLYVYCIARIKDMSRFDVSDKNYATYLLYKKYPDLPQYFESINNRNGV